MKSNSSLNILFILSIVKISISPFFFSGTPKTLCLLAKGVSGKDFLSKPTFCELLINPPVLFKLRILLLTNSNFVSLIHLSIISKSNVISILINFSQYSSISLIEFDKI